MESLYTLYPHTMLATHPSTHPPQTPHTHLGVFQPHPLCRICIGFVLPLKRWNGWGLICHILTKFITTHATFSAYATMTAIRDGGSLVWVWVCGCGYVGVGVCVGEDVVGYSARVYVGGVILWLDTVRTCMVVV